MWCDMWLLCSLVQVVRVVIVHVILVGVGGVTVVHIGHDEILVVLKSVAIFVVIFCIWRCTFLQLLWNSAKLVKIFPGIIARLHHTDRRLMVLRKEQCAE